MRNYLAMNHKIRLNSEMSEGEIFQEIRSVFDGPMAGADDFPFYKLVVRHLLLRFCHPGQLTQSLGGMLKSFLPRMT